MKKALLLLKQGEWLFLEVSTLFKEELFSLSFLMCIKHQTREKAIMIHDHDKSQMIKIEQNSQYRQWFLFQTFFTFENLKSMGKSLSVLINIEYQYVSIPRIWIVFLTSLCNTIFLISSASHVIISEQWYNDHLIEIPYLHAFA